MDYNEFSALTRGLRSIPESKTPGPKIGAGTDASAIHGRLSAQVALLQSPILSAAKSPYTKRKSFRGLPVDKPHTRPLAVPSVVSSYVLRFTFCSLNQINLCSFPFPVVRCPPVNSVPF